MAQCRCRAARRSGSAARARVPGNRGGAGVASRSIRSRARSAAVPHRGQPWRSARGRRRRRCRNRRRQELPHRHAGVCHAIDASPMARTGDADDACIVLAGEEGRARASSRSRMRRGRKVRRRSSGLRRQGLRHGDSQRRFAWRAVSRLARHCGIAAFAARQSPADKLERVNALTRRGRIHRDGGRWNQRCAGLGRRGGVDRHEPRIRVDAGKCRPDPGRRFLAGAAGRLSAGAPRDADHPAEPALGGRIQSDRHAARRHGLGTALGSRHRHVLELDPGRAEFLASHAQGGRHSAARRRR